MKYSITQRFKKNPTIYYVMSIVASWAGIGSLMKEHIEEIIDRATDAASISIERKGVQKLLEQATKQV